MLGTAREDDLLVTLTLSMDGVAIDDMDDSALRSSAFQRRGGQHLPTGEMYRISYLNVSHVVVPL